MAADAYLQIEGITGEPCAITAVAKSPTHSKRYSMPTSRAFPANRSTPCLNTSILLCEVIAEGGLNV